MAQRYFIELSYRGTNYHGWQIQPNGNSIQSELEKALSTLLKEDISTTGAGRTDAGVHASFYVAHFDSEHDRINQKSKFIYHLNSVLPTDISVRDIVPVKAEAHARFSALSRSYNYVISRNKDPFSLGLAWQFYGPLNVDLMRLAADSLLLHSDFTSFSKVGSDNKTSICKVYTANWEEKDGKLIFNIRADRFLRNMVRAIVGTLVDVGRNKIGPNEFVRIIDAKDRSLAGASAPAEGLYLNGVEYPVDLYLNKR
ncbi:MAG: tRNA pseudouridine(38-40) synthase TruA [Tenuifilaceae bacterium]|nr:tRNA pseudouridine(38-40) synthase TruA [Tenuifilaceae bacterium]